MKWRKHVANRRQLSDTCEMNRTRRIAALRFLQRLHKNDIDIIARELAILRARETEIVRRKQTLRDSVRSEVYCSSVEPAPYFASYLEAVKHEMEYLDSVSSEIETRSQKLEAELLEKFRIAKSDEEPLHHALELAKRQEKRAEAISNDEIARNMALFSPGKV